MSYIQPLQSAAHKPKRFIILVEVIERELPASVLLGAELAARGHNVRLIEKGRFRRSPASFLPSIVLEKGLSKGCLPKYRSIRNAGHVLAVMCQEGFTYRSGDDYIERRVCADTIQMIDYLFFWGERQKQDLSHFVDSVPGSRVSGNPRFDLLHSRFHACWEAQEADIKREYGDFVLFTSRFGAVNHFRRSLVETVDRRKQQYSGRAAESVARRIEILGKLFNDYVKAIRDMAVRFPKLKFVVRPHPRENPDLWRAHFKDTANVWINEHGMAVPWLSAARCVIHNCCTTGIEAYLLGKPVTEYYPGSLVRSEFDPILPGEITGVSDSLEALEAWIESHAIRGETGHNRDKAADELLAYHLQNYREPNAYAEMAAALEGVRSPAGWARLMNKLSLKRDEKKMKDRYIELDEVNRLLGSYVACKVSNGFVRARADQLGIRLRKNCKKKQNLQTRVPQQGAPPAPHSSPRAPVRVAETSSET